ncbi:MAG: phosphatase PAP2 family protein [Bacteroidetes bacterium]|nr:phosphatase PAP2 family protein [Bacteroidota bacterium]
MQALLEFDLQLFELINQQWSNSFFDALLPYFRNKYIWAPLYIFIIVFLLVNYRNQGWKIILLSVLCVTLTDQISSSLIKPLIGRLRPCHELADQIRLLVNCGAGYSFVSSHAANHFGFAVLISIFLGEKWKWVWPTALSWAVIVSYSQVYVGVHYPLDIIGGALLGAVIGWSVSRLMNLASRKRLN